MANRFQSYYLTRWGSYGYGAFAEGASYKALKWMDRTTYWQPLEAMMDDTAAMISGALPSELG